MDYLLEGDPGHSEVIRKLAAQKDAVLYEKLMKIKEKAYKDDHHLYTVFNAHDPNEEPIEFRKMLSQRGYEIVVKEPLITYEGDESGYQARVDLSETIVIIKKIVFIA